MPENATTLLPAERAHRERADARPTQEQGAPERALEALSIVDGRRDGGPADGSARLRHNLSPIDVLALQRTAGNRAVTSVLAGSRRADHTRVRPEVDRGRSGPSTAITSPGGSGAVEEAGLATEADEASASSEPATVLPDAATSAPSDPPLPPPAATPPATPPARSSSGGGSIPVAGMSKLGPRPAGPLQREVAAPRPPLKGKKAGKSVATFPLEVTELDSAIEEMPKFAAQVARLKVFREPDKVRLPNLERVEFEGKKVSAATIFCLDAIFRFDGEGVLQEVETNYQHEPTDDEDEPPQKFPVTSNAIVLTEPYSKASWQILQAATGDLAAVPLAGLKNPGDDYAEGQLLVLMYYPAYAADWPTVPQVGYKRDVGKDSGKNTTTPNETAPKEQKVPKWAEKQYYRVLGTLGSGLEEGDAQGTGTGAAGEGQGGGGKAAEGAGGAAAPGVGTGSGTLVIRGPGTGGKPRAKPDKVVVYQGRRGPAVNVWVGQSHEAIPVKEGESDDAFRQRIQEAAARQKSSGKRLAETKPPPGMEGGQAAGNASAADIAEATKFSATGMAYPSKIEMQGGSGADVSPKGWATTVTGADHKFDMILDWDAISFGADRVWNRLEFLSYYWQVIDVSKASFGRTEDGAARDAARESSKDAANVRKVGHWENLRAVGRTVQEAGEGIEKDSPSLEWYDVSGTWGIKASMLAIEGISATWDIAKALVGQFFAKVTSPENRRPISFDAPGEYVVRCLVNPIEKKAKPGQPPPSRRATSIAAFPVRVLDIDERALEVNREEESTIEGMKRALAVAQAAFDAYPDDPGKKIAVDMLADRLAKAQKRASGTTTERLHDDVKEMNAELAAIEALLVSGGTTQGLEGEVLEWAIRVQKEYGLYAKWQLENRREDLKKAKDVKLGRAAQAAKWSGQLKTPEVRPRVTLVSEENGAVVKMDMLLGQAEGSDDYRPKWALMDVTTEMAQHKYEGEASQPGKDGHNEAIRKAFQAYADKAEYGRGTLAIDIPPLADTGGKPDVPRTLLMTQGAPGRWQKRLENLVEIAGLVAPFSGGAALGRFAAIGGALTSAYRLYDRAANDKLKADFEAVTDIMGVLAPFIEGGKALSELKGVKETSTGVILRVATETSDMVDEFMVPFGIYYQVDQVVKDTSMGGPEKQAAIATILGRAARDKAIQQLGKQYRYNKDRDAEIAGMHPSPHPTGHPAEEGVPIKGEGPVTEGDGTASGPKRPGDEAEGGAGGSRRPGGDRPASAGGGSEGSASAYEAGMPDGAMANLKAFAQKHGVVIDVRPPGFHTRGRFAEGAIPKPSNMKAKTINEIDRLIGAPPESLGLVGYFNPELPPRPKGMTDVDWTRVQERAVERAKEFTDLAGDMQRLADEGTIHVVSGVVTMVDPRGPVDGPDRFKAVAGDVDLFEIHWANGKPMEDGDANFFADELRKMNIGIQHGAHLRWVPATAKDKKIYQDIIASHDPGGKPLLRFAPDMNPHRVDNMTPVAPSTAKPVRPEEVTTGPGTPGHGSDPEPDIGAEIRPGTRPDARPLDVSAGHRAADEFRWGTDAERKRTRDAYNEAVKRLDELDKDPNRKPDDPERIDAEAALRQARREFALAHNRYPGKPPPPLLKLPEATVLTLDNARSESEARAAFERMRADQPAKEAGLFYNARLNQWIVVQGTDSRVQVLSKKEQEQDPGARKTPAPGGEEQRWKNDLLPKDRGVWELIAHTHPGDPKTGIAPITQHFPSIHGGDVEFIEAAANAAGGKDRESEVWYMTEDGLRKTRFGVTFWDHLGPEYDRTAHELPKYWVERDGDQRVYYRDLDTMENEIYNFTHFGEPLKGVPPPGEAPPAKKVDEPGGTASTKPKPPSGGEPEIGARKDLVATVDEEPAGTIRTADEPGQGTAAAAAKPAPPMRAGYRAAPETAADLGKPVTRPTGVEFDPRPADRYTGSPTTPNQGQSEGYVLYDTVEKKDVLFKPTDNEKPVDRAQERGIAVRDYAGRSKATEITADRLGIPTPKVELVKIGDKTGSVTDWESNGYKSLWDINDDNPYQAKLIRESDEFKYFMDGIDALDFLTNNLDRGANYGNYLVKLRKDGSVEHVIPIDHDLTFTGSVPRATIKDRTRGLPEYYPPDVADKIRELGRDRQAFIRSIEPLVGPEAIPGVLHRLDEMIQDLEIKTRAGTVDRPMPAGSTITGVGRPTNPT